MTQPLPFAPGNVINTCHRLWRVDACHGEVLTATAIDSQAEQVQFYLPFETIQPGELPLPAASRVGTYQAQQLLLRAYRLGMLHGTAPLLSLQRSRVIPKDYQLVPVVMSLEMPRVRLKEQLADASVSVEVARANALNEDTGERLDEEEAGLRVERTPFGPVKAIQAEWVELDKVLALAEKVSPGRDAKLQKLLDSVLAGRLSRYPKVVIFTRYLDTLQYLAEQIGRDKRYADTEVLTIYGGLNERQRRELFSAFDRAKKAVLVATDAISEGINLRHACAQVIHYELPWNPNRLEQRNGRVDRFGQRQPLVYIRTMVMDETLDATILKVLVEKAGAEPPVWAEEQGIGEAKGKISPLPPGVFRNRPSNGTRLAAPNCGQTSTGCTAICTVSAGRSWLIFWTRSRLFGARMSPVRGVSNETDGVGGV